MSVSRSCTALGISTLTALVLTLSGTSLAAQTWSVGTVFPLFGTEEFCESSALGAFHAGYEAPLGNSSIEGQVEAYYAPNGFYPWPWIPIGGGGGGEQAPSAYDHNGGVRLAVNFLVPLTQRDSYDRGLQVRALAGFGARRLGASQYSEGGDGDPEQFGVDTQIAPLLTAGLVVDIGVSDNVGLRLQGRGNAIFSGDLQLRGATSAQDRVLSSDTQVFAQAMAGLTIAVGR